jgi:hypothetical protein
MPFILKLSSKTKRLVDVIAYTRNSMKTIFGYGGIWLRTVGINATKAIITVDIEATLSARLFSWKNITRLMIASSHSGRNITAIDTYGNLYIGTLKWA